MSSPRESLANAPPVEPATDEDERVVGVVTRSVSWVLDAVAINVVAILTGLGAELVLSIFPVSPDSASVLKPIAGAVYLIWAALYFVLFWTWTGQTLGARVMRIRLQTEKRRRVKPVRAVVRWVGMNLAMIPLFAGFAPILFGRRGFPDWLARTVVLETQQPSLAAVQRARVRAAAAHDDRHHLPPPVSPGPEPSVSAFGDGGQATLEMHGHPDDALTG